MTDSKLNIAIAGLMPEEEECITMAICSLIDEDFQLDYQDVNFKQAHLVITDPETEYGQQVLQQARPGQVKVLLSNTQKNEKNLITLGKPVSLPQFLTFLTRLYQAMQQQLNKDKPSTEKMETEEPELSNALFKLLLDAKEKQQIIQLTLNGQAELFINGKSKSYILDADIEQIKPLLSLPAEKITTQPVSESRYNELSREFKVAALYRLLWVAGIFGSNGILLDKHSTTSKVKLRAWPNFTRNDFHPYHLKLAAILAKQAMSIDQLTQSAGIAKSEIINFYNAAFSVDLIEHVNEIEEKALEKKQLTPQRQGLLSRLASKLKLGGVAYAS